MSRSVRIETLIDLFYPGVPLAELLVVAADPDDELRFWCRFYECLARWPAR